MSTIKTPEAVEKQARAMRASAFEVGLFDPTAVQGVMLPRAWDLATLFRSVSWLRLKNSQGRNIYIRPSCEHALSLIDDASGQAIELMKSTGFAPAVVLETSPWNYQAWLCHGQILPKHLSPFAARLLASPLAVILLRRIGGTTEGLLDSRIAKINIGGWMEPFHTSGCLRPRELRIQELPHFSRKSELYMIRSNPSLSPRLFPAPEPVSF